MTETVDGVGRTYRTSAAFARATRKMPPLSIAAFAAREEAGPFESCTGMR
jgi:hypothetical protein